MEKTDKQRQKYKVLKIENILVRTISNPRIDETLYGSIQQIIAIILLTIMTIIVILIITRKRGKKILITIIITKSLLLPNFLIIVIDASIISSLSSRLSPFSTLHHHYYHYYHHRYIININNDFALSAVTKTITTSFNSIITTPTLTPAMKDYTELLQQIHCFKRVIPSLIIIIISFSIMQIYAK